MHFGHLFGETRLDSVYPGISIQDTNRFIDTFEDRYDELGLVSPNGMINKFINFNAFNLRFDIEFFSWGVRNNYGEIPVVTKFFLSMLKNQYLYYSSHGDYLLSLAYSAII